MACNFMIPLAIRITFTRKVLIGHKSYKSTWVLHKFEIFRHVGSVLGDISNGKSVTAAY